MAPKAPIGESRITRPMPANTTDEAVLKPFTTVSRLSPSCATASPAITATSKTWSTLPETKGSSALSGTSDMACAACALSSAACVFVVSSVARSTCMRSPGRIVRTTSKPSASANVVMTSK